MAALNIEGVVPGWGLRVACSMSAVGVVAARGMRTCVCWDGWVEGP